MPEKPFEAYPGNEPYIFASYAHADRDEVYPELQRMHEAGFRIWYDEGINPTENWVGVIPRRIATCTLFVVFISPQAIASRWVRKELSLADRKALPILPIFLSETPLDEELDFQIGSTQSLLRHELSETEYRNKLDRQLRTYEGLAPPTLPPDQALARELHLSHEVQRDMFRNRAEAPAGYSLASWLQTWGRVGGDIHESRILPDGRWLVLIGDIAGKGIPAALVATLLLGMFDIVFAEPAVNLPAAVARVNAAFCQRVENYFATVTLMLIDPATHQMTVVNAGHFMPLVRRGSGVHWEFPIDRTGLPLGVMPDAAYEAVETQLDPGDVVLTVTDGVTDAMTPDGRLFGLEGIHRVVERTGGSAERLVEQLRASLIFHMGGGRFADDVTVVSLGRNPVLPPAARR